MLRNRLQDDSSPYLQQHRSNPVFWQPWDDEAIRLAQTLDRPIFLSIGYSTCHWCHVMEHESFEDDEVAKILNEKFVCIKVDREVRPDLDDAYMAVVQGLTGRGGWPMSVFLTPDLKPIYAGTYWPKNDRGRYSGFITIIKYLSDIWDKNRSEVLNQASELCEVIKNRRQHSLPKEAAHLREDLLIQCQQSLMLSFDHENGGIGSKPKFPPHTSLRFLQTKNDPQSKIFCERTLERMALGGIHDWVGGGFHRYSTDEMWKVPHFEKMLYDNALLIGVYGKTKYKKIAERVKNWLQREMRSETGLYFSALDADSNGEEGLYYSWPYSEAEKLVSSRFLEHFQFGANGNYDDEATGKPSGRNILFCNTMPADELFEELDILLKERMKRQFPFRDEKCLISWNGLLMAGFVDAQMVENAEDLANTILSLDHIPHQIIDGVPSGAGFGDIAYLIHGFLKVFHSTKVDKYLRFADHLFVNAAKRFRDPAGGWFLSENEDAVGLGRTKPWQDSPLPSINSIMIENACSLGYEKWAEDDLIYFQGWMDEFPLASEGLHISLETFLNTYRVQIRVEDCTIQSRKLSCSLMFTIPKDSHIGGFSEANLSKSTIRIIGLDSQLVEVESNESTLSGQFKIRLEGELVDDSPVAEISYQLCAETECKAIETVRVPLTGV